MTSPTAPRDSSDLRRGDLIMHYDYGFGHVLAVQGVDPSRQAHIDFCIVSLWIVLPTPRIKVLS